jgi:peptidyl-prolyl cis-trans isomerase A (cyclophilin A)
MRLSAALALVALTASFAFAQAPETDLPSEPGLYAVFNTSMGAIVARLFDDKTPATVKNFVALAEGTKPSANTAGALVKKHYYDGLTFHRVIKGFMIQTGDIRGTGTSDCGVPRLKDEIDPSLKFDSKGRLAMANTGRPNTAACQIFITVGIPADGALDGKYTIFGQVVSGQDIADKIAAVPVNGEKPILPVKLTSVTIKRKE